MIAESFPIAVSFPRVVRSEWTKLWSLRSTRLVLAVTVLLTVGFAAAFGHGYGEQLRSGEVTAEAGKAIDVTFIGLDLSALLVGVVGILQISGEYGSGSIRACLVAVPRRWPVLLAKALVLAVVVAALMAPAAVASFVLAQRLMGEPGAAALGDPGALRALLGATLYPVATALIGLGLGAVLRHTALTITVFVAGLLILPAMLAPALPDSAERAVMPYVPIAAAQAVYTQLPAAGSFRLLSPGPGLLVLLAWVTVTLAAGTFVLLRRDA